MDRRSFIATIAATALATKLQATESTPAYSSKLIELHKKALELARKTGYRSMSVIAANPRTYDKLYQDKFDQDQVIAAQDLATGVALDCLDAHNGLVKRIRDGRIRNLIPTNPTTIHKIRFCTICLGPCNGTMAFALLKEYDQPNDWGIPDGQLNFLGFNLDERRLYTNLGHITI